MRAPSTSSVVLLNYHRIGDPDALEPEARLHTIDAVEFERQVELVTERAAVISLDHVVEGAVERPSVIFTFDDVSYGARAGIERLRSAQLPYAAFVCGSLAERGHGERDKVYELVTAHHPKYLRSRAAEVFGELVGDDFDFYRFTKSAAVPPDVVAVELIDPLFRELGVELPRRYLSWDEVARELLTDPLAIVGSHGWSHANLAAFSADAIQSDVERCHLAFESTLGHRPVHYAVPFGNVDQRLALYLVAALRRRSYRTCAWVGEAANAVLGPRRHQVVHLVRLHAPGTVGELRALLDHVSVAPRLTLAQTIPARPHARRVNIRGGTGLDGVAPIETVLRNEKDYVLDPHVHRYLYTENPYRDGKPEYHLVEEDGVAEAVIYAFAMPFRVAGVPVLGAYISGWRKLPRSHRYAAGMLLPRVVQDQVITGVYNPNDLVRPAFVNWRAVQVRRVTLPTSASLPLPAHEAGDAMTDEVAVLAGEASRTVDLGVDRTAALFLWRYGRYSMATVRYLWKPGRWYAVLLVAGERASVSDWWAGHDDVLDLVGASTAHARAAGCATIQIESSRPGVADMLFTLEDSAAESFTNYYRLDEARIAAAGIDPRLLQSERELRFHETELSGDVLLR